MKVQGVELRRVGLPLKSPFRTSFGVDYENDVLLVRVETDGAEGWGECVAGSAPDYSEEYVDGSIDVLRRFMVPALLERDDVRADDVRHLLSWIKGHRMAKAALEAAMLDAELRGRHESFAQRLGAVRGQVPAGVSVGIMDGIGELLDAVQGFLDDGYVRIKLKIAPGWDLDPVRAVRERFGDDLQLQVDANAAYSLVDAAHLAKLDAFGLLLIEQPLGDEDLRQHAELARLIRTPVCLDESITSARVAADAIALGACRVINIKPGRVGGYLEAVRIHDVASAHGVAVWCGGMLETGIGRAGNVALAALPGFTLPGDTSASDRYYDQDITAPFVLRDGHIDVPAGPGLGVQPLDDVLPEVTTSKEWLSRSS